MEEAVILILFIVFFVLEYLGATSLVLLNLAYLRRRAGEVPAAFKEFMDEDTSRRASRYARHRSAAGLAANAFSSALVLSGVVTGLFGAFDRWLASFALGFYLHGLFFIAGVSLAWSLVGLPFAFYHQFVIEKRFGFNKMTPALFFMDRLKSLALSALLGGPLLVGLFFFMETAGPWWWLLAFAFLAAVQAVVTLLYPSVIAPLFNKFTPLPDGALKESTQRLLESLGCRVRGIYVMDGSKRSGHSNAYFTGLGKTKRVVLFDTLVKTLSADEIGAVFAHEVGHQQRGHVAKNLLLGTAGGALIFFVLSLILNYAPLYRAFGFDAISYHALLLIVSLCTGPLTFFLRPLFSAISRAHEYEADRFAKNACAGDPGPLIRALLKLSRDNLSSLHPHPLYSFFYYSHPTLPERVRALEKA